MEYTNGIGLIEAVKWDGHNIEVVKGFVSKGTKVELKECEEYEYLYIRNVAGT